MDISTSFYLSNKKFSLFLIESILTMPDSRLDDFTLHPCFLAEEHSMVEFIDIRSCLGDNYRSLLPQLGLLYTSYMFTNIHVRCTAF